MRALIACLLWLVGVEAMPAAHLAFHDAASHHHEGDQIVADHDDDDDHHDFDREVTQDELDHPEHAHDGGGLAHHATAVAPPAPPPAVIPPSHGVTFDARDVAVALVSLVGLAPSARGPPRAVCTFT